MVEQRIHKPKVGSSTLPPATTLWLRFYEDFGGRKKTKVVLIVSLREQIYCI